MKATHNKFKGWYFADSDAAINRSLVIAENQKSNSDDLALNTHFEKSGIKFIQSISNVSDGVENNKREKTVPLRQRTLPASFWQEPDDRSYTNMALYANALNNQPQMIMNDPLTQQYISQYYGIHWPPLPQATGEFMKLLLNRQQNQQSHLSRLGVAKPAVHDIGVFSHRLANLQSDECLRRINSNNSQCLRQQCYNDSNYPVIPAMHMRKATRFSEMYNICDARRRNTMENVLHNTVTSSPASNHRNYFLSDQRTFFHSNKPDFRFSPCNIRNALDLRNLPLQDYPIDNYIKGNATGAETLYHQPITFANTRIPMPFKPIATKSGLNGNRYHPYM